MPEPEPKESSPGSSGNDHVGPSALPLGQGVSVESLRAIVQAGALDELLLQSPAVSQVAARLADLEKKEQLSAATLAQISQQLQALITHLSGGTASPATPGEGAGLGSQLVPLIFQLLQGALAPRAAPTNATLLSESAKELMAVMEFGNKLSASIVSQTLASALKSVAELQKLAKAAGTLLPEGKEPTTAPEPVPSLASE